VIGTVGDFFAGLIKSFKIRSGVSRILIIVATNSLMDLMKDLFSVPIDSFAAAGI
jgi:hypothetical protein